jgi:diaminopimelate decarboxylase
MAARDRGRFADARKRVNQSPLGAAALAVTGVDMHIGSQITELEPFDDAFALLFDFVRTLRADGHAISHVDLGGGLGIPYRDDNEPPPHPDAYAAMVKRATRDFGCRLIFEPGRLIVGNAGILVTRVLYLKRGEAKTFVIVDAGMNDLIRPTLYEAHHEIWPVRRARWRMSPGRSANPATSWPSTAIAHLQHAPWVPEVLVRQADWACRPGSKADRELLNNILLALF